MRITVFYKIILCLFLLIPKTTYSINPPVIKVIGNQTYCGASMKIVESVNIVFDSTDPEIYSVYIQISSGYIIGQDQLTLNNASLHPSINTIPFDPNTGILKLISANGNKVSSTDFEAAIKDVQFVNSSPTPSLGTRNFSITIGQANYLPSNKHFYRYISRPGITWTKAKEEAESTANEYYGIKRIFGDTYSSR